MEMNVLSSTLSQGSVFTIETHKTVDMAEGAPSIMMLKVSRYSITTALPKKPEPTSWWSYTATESIVVKKGSMPRLYLLCAMHKGAGRGESSFYSLNTDTGEFDMSKAYSKHEVEKFLPSKEPFEADHITLPIDSIESLECLDTKRVVADEWVFPDKPCNVAPIVPGLVQISKPSPWAGMPITKLPKVEAWDPSFAPAEYA